MRNIKLTIEYDGKDFNGWQKQPDKLNIQGTIEKAIEAVTGEVIDLNASGRTDAGVHAIGQVANFKTNSKIPIEKIPLELNTKLKHKEQRNEVDAYETKENTIWSRKLQPNVPVRLPYIINQKNRKPYT